MKVKVVGLAGHGKINIDLYNVWKNIIKIDDLRTELDPKTSFSWSICRNVYCFL
jgi:hypothetical protein